jgi:hypothetical protein
MAARFRSGVDAMTISSSPAILRGVRRDLLHSDIPGVAELLHLAVPVMQPPSYDFSRIGPPVVSSSQCPVSHQVPNQCRSVVASR